MRHARPITTNPPRNFTTKLSFSTVLVTLVLLTALVGCASKKQPPAPATRHYTFWPDAPDLPRIQYLVSYNTSDDVAAPAKEDGFSSLVFGQEKPDAVPITKPYGVALWNGRIYVCDVRGTGVMVLDVVKHQARIMGASGAGSIQKAVDVAVAPDGTKYVADPNRGTVMVYDAEERFVRPIHIPECSPVGVAVNGNELYICDFNQFNVRVLDRASGKQLRTIGMQGGEDGKFVRPLGIAVDQQGNIVVSDLIRCRIQKFSPDGKLLLAYGEAGNRPGNFDKPKHLEVASDGISYIIDAAFNNVQMFDEEGKVLMYFGSPGTHPGALNLPAGIAISDADVGAFESYVHPAFKAERIIVVTSQFGPTRVSVYAMGSLREGKTLDDIAATRTVGETTQPTDMTTPPLPPIDSPAQPTTAPSTQP